MIRHFDVEIQQHLNKSYGDNLDLTIHTFKNYCQTDNFLCGSYLTINEIVTWRRFSIENKPLKFNIILRIMDLTAKWYPFIYHQKNLIRKMLLNVTFVRLKCLEYKKAFMILKASVVVHKTFLYLRIKLSFISFGIFFRFFSVVSEQCFKKCKILHPSFMK